MRKNESLLGWVVISGGAAFQANIELVERMIYMYNYRGLVMLCYPLNFNVKCFIAKKKKKTFIYVPTKLINENTFTYIYSGFMFFLDSQKRERLTFESTVHK